MTAVRWTIGDMETVEQLAGVDFGDLQEVVKAATVAKRLRAVAALVYVQAHKDDDTLTFDAVMNMTADELVALAAPLIADLTDTPAPLVR